MSEQLLRKVPLFSTSTLSDLQRLRRVAEVLRVAPGTLLFARGDAGDALYLIRKGKVRIFLSNENGQEWTLAVLQPFEFFGEIALLAESARTASALALDEVEVLRIDRARFLELLHQNPAMGLPILTQMGRRMRDMAERMAGAAFMTVEQRVGAKLLDLAHASEASGMVETTRQELAFAVGAVRETVSKVLNDLRRRGCLELTRGRVRIVDETGLRRAVFGPMAL